MSWSKLRVAHDRTHHTDVTGAPVYEARFDDVLKFHAPGLAPVARAGSAWHIRPDGSAAYTQRYRRTFGFYEGLAAVEHSDGWHHITPEGQALYTPRYDWCGNFQGGRCAIRSAASTYLHIDSEGAPVYEARWRYAGDYRDGVAVVQASDGRSTHIDLNGRPLHSRWFVDLDVFHKGFARARDEEGWCHVDVRGHAAYTRRFAAVEPFYNGQARVECFDGALEVIDERGQTRTQLRPPRRSEFAQLSADMVGFWRTQTIGAAVELGLPEVLPATPAELAARRRLTPDGAMRLLRALGELQLVVNHGDRWELTARGAFLRRDHPLTLADAALEYAGPLAQMWRALPQALSAQSSWSAPDIFGEVARDDGRRDGHHRMLSSYALHDYPSVVEALEVDANAHVIDAGGGLGALARLLLRKQPTAQVTILERPEVVDAGRRGAPHSSLQWHAASLFDDWGLQADAVILARVLHDWDDEDALRILQRARATLSAGGRVSIVEMLLHEGRCAGGQCDLHLLMATGGRERSAEHYNRLLRAAGFTSTGVHHTTALPAIVTGVAS